MFLARRLEAIAAAAILTMFVPSAAYSQSSSEDDSRIQLELTTMDKRGTTIARVREQVLTMLQSENACAAWFREADSDPEGVFRSLHYEIKEDGPFYVLRWRDRQGEVLFKYPWVARTTENGGRNSTVELNAAGAFFHQTSRTWELSSIGSWGSPGGNRTLIVGPFEGNTAEARITALLHELGHIVGRLPEDDDSWDGRSSRNTAEVLRHCRQEIRAAAQEVTRRRD